MTSREREMADTLEEPVRSIALAVFKYFDEVLLGSRWRVAFIGPLSCRRTAVEQNGLYQLGRSLPGKIVTKCDGYLKPSNHQPGWAFDIGIRDTWANEIVWYRDSSVMEPHQYFRQLVAFLIEAGMSWAGDWEDPWDWHHFEWKGTE